MIGNKSFLTNYQEIYRGFVAFGGSPKGDLPFWLLALDYFISKDVFDMAWRWTNTANYIYYCYVNIDVPLNTTIRQALNEDTELPQTSVPIPNVLDEAVYEEWDDSVERATTTAASLDATQNSGGSLRCQETTRGSIAQTRSKEVPTPPHDSPLPRVNTLGSDETKNVYGTAYTKLIMKVKELEKTVKSNQARRRTNVVVSNDEEDSEDSSK
nr:hypothetical protein [Tanacetum cinerariifolium]